jgi:hypothetical protein
LTCSGVNGTRRCLTPVASNTIADGGKHEAKSYLGGWRRLAAFDQHDLNLLQYRIDVYYRLSLRVQASDPVPIETPSSNTRKMSSVAFCNIVSGSQN